ncbi:MAG: response regulator [Streptosporangiales bacterium]|nr:response regulator [Streptosporangiales bacterium]
MTRTRRATTPKQDGAQRYREEDLRALLAGLTAMRDGNFRARLTPTGDDLVAQIATVFNEVADRNEHLSREVARIRRAVGKDGRVSERIAPSPGGGSWAGTVQSANALLDDLIRPAIDAVGVIDAVAGGDISQRVPLRVGERPLRGEILALGKSVNRLLDRLEGFTSEVTRVAHEVGDEGKLGAQARLGGMSGTWKEVTESVNRMSSRLTAQVRDIAVVTTAVARGDLSRKVTVEVSGEMLELKNIVNTMVDQLSAFADEVTRVAREVGTEGRLGGQAQVRGVSGVWKDLTDSVNVMAGNLTSQVRNIAQVATAVAQGDLSQKITVDVKGEILELKNTINTMVDQLSAFADEVTRVAREVGTEGRLGGQAQVQGISGTWRDLTQNVNSMAGNLTSQVRNIAEVTTAVAQGDLGKKITVDAQGEILQLKDTINTMVDQLSAFADEVTRVAREVGTEGRLGGQAEVEDISGTWKRLTESVNELAGNLTTQVRAIAEVASAVTRGDLTRSISVETRGEVAELKDNINLMVTNLRGTTQANEEQDWLKSNLARISGLMQGHRDLMELAGLIMSEVTPVVSAQYGAFYLAESTGDDTEFRLIASYGHRPRGPVAFAPGESLVGQVAVEKKPLLVEELPPNYITVRSGLGGATPTHLLVLPILFEDEVLAVIELASLHRFGAVHRGFLDQFVGTLGVTINTNRANSRTESLLKESQRLAQELRERSDELQSQQSELRRSNIELEEKAELLAEQNRAIEFQNNQIEQARRALEERAEQLALSSRYKSEFLANMSHELRTPLNSLLILAKLLAENTDGTLTPKHVDYAKTIYSAGSDLLQLINDILDLSKVEAGKMDVQPHEVPLDQLVDYVEATFRPLTLEKGLRFAVDVSPDVPGVLHTDERRLQQILRNLLSNAVKFTESGEVRLLIEPATGVRFTDKALQDAENVVAFSVMDTGVGIAADKLHHIFEAFQQADGTMIRRYGGTGLGLSISREIVKLIDGEIHVDSEPGRGSTFTLYIPAELKGSRTFPGGTALPHGQDSLGADPGPSADGRDELAVAGVPEAITDGTDRPAEGAGRPGGSPDGGFRVNETLMHATLPAPRRTDEIGAAWADLPGPEPRGADQVLAGRKVLIVDDDVRNVFALTCVLEQYGIDVLYAENGRQGIEKLERNEDVSLVLMDVMMPEMDGYATTEAIRTMPQFADLPIIALTAKAMKGDREKSIASGASDHVPKPVDIDHLLDVMRRWIYV